MYGLYLVDNQTVNARKGVLLKEDDWYELF